MPRFGHCSEVISGVTRKPTCCRDDFVREQRGLRGLSNLRIFTRSGENIGGNGISLETPLIACFQKNEFKIIGVWGLKNGSHRRALGCGVVSLSSFTLWIGVCRPRRGFNVQQTAILKPVTDHVTEGLWESSSVAKQRTVAVHFDQPAAGAEIGAGKPPFLKRKCTPNRQIFPILPDRRLNF